MPNIKIQREAVYKDFAATPGPCPKCSGALEQANLPYMVVTRTGNRMGDSFLISGNFGWYCQSCPVVVLNQAQLSQMMGFSKPGWKVGQEFSVMGVINLDAIPENKRHLPLSSPEMPNVLVKFSNLDGEKPISKKRHRKT
jgi:hypothetical protein